MKPRALPYVERVIRDYGLREWLSSAEEQALSVEVATAAAEIAAEQRLGLTDKELEFRRSVGTERYSVWAADVRARWMRERGVSVHVD